MSGSGQRNEPAAGPAEELARLRRVLEETSRRIAELDPGAGTGEDPQGQAAWKLAEQQLQQAGALLRIAGRMARIGGWGVDLARQQVEWSDEVGEIHGLPMGTVLTLGEAIAFYAPECRDRIREQFFACVRQGTAFDDEVEILPVQGGRLWVRIIGEAVRDSEGAVVRVQGALQDVTDRKRAEAALTQGERRFRQFADALPQPIWTARPDGRVDFFNRAFRNRFGAGTADPQSWLWSAILPAEEGPRWAENWRHSVAQGEQHSDAHRLRTADGEERWHLVTAAPVRDESGAILRWYGTAIDDHDRKRAEEETRRLAHRLDSVLNAIQEAFYTVDRDWHVTFMNDQAEQMLGKARADLIGRRLWDVFPAAVGSRPHREYRRALAEKVPVHFEYRSEVLGLWLDVSAYPLEDGLAVHLRDVSDRHAAIQTLRQSEARFRAAAQATSHVVWDLDLASGRIWWSSEAARVFGYAPAEMGADLEAWRSRIHPEDRERVDASSRRAVEQRHPYWSEKYRFLHKDGSILEVEDRGYLILDAAGVPVQFVGGLSDITDRERILAQLAQQAALLDEAQDAIVVLDMDRRVTFWNRGAERIYGWTAPEAMNRPIAALVGGDAAELDAAVEAVRTGGQWRGSLSQRTGAGAPLIVEANWTLVRTPGGAPRAILAIHSDVTERRALEEQLRRSQRLETIGQLTGGIAHDFNNLLTVILGNAELLLEAAGEDGRLSRLAATTRTAAERGAELTSRLLAFARRQPLDPKPVDVDRLLADMDDLLRRALGGGVEVKLVRSAGLWPALVDAPQLESAILNLCVNARDAMPGGGRLIIETANVDLGADYAATQAEVVPGPYVLIAVSDTGTGMPPDTVARVFDPFFTTKEAGKGTGLGLSMVYGFIKQSRGHVGIYSEPGVGTTLKLYLPRASAAVTAVEAGLAVGEPEGGSGTILVVEDDELVRGHVAVQLAGLGYRVLTAASGPEALEIVRGAEELDLLFTDIVMPGGMNGRALAEAARRLRPGLPVLFTSGYARNAIVHHGRLDAGVQLLSKPYRRQELAAKVRQVLGRTREG